jgi:pyruvate, water dikinase
MTATDSLVLEFGSIRMGDIARVGGKNASLGELFNVFKKRGVGVLDGFAVTAFAYEARRTKPGRMNEDW